jgi:hypothetical protein
MSGCYEAFRRVERERVPQRARTRDCVSFVHSACLEARDPERGKNLSNMLGAICDHSPNASFGLDRL